LRKSATTPSQKKTAERENRAAARCGRKIVPKEKPCFLCWKEKEKLQRRSPIICLGILAKGNNALLEEWTKGIEVRTFRKGGGKSVEKTPKKKQQRLKPHTNN